MNQRIEQFIEDDHEALLTHRSEQVSKSSLHLPGADFVDRVWMDSDRSIPVLVNLQRLFAAGRLGGTGYLSILPVDQGVEHSAGASFAANPTYFDPENIVILALEGGCNAVASTLGVLGSMARRYAHRIPFVVKLNHNELLTYPKLHDQIYFSSIRQAADMGAAAIGATIYFGSDCSRHQIVETSRAFHLAHEMGLATILWCYLRNSDFRQDQDHHTAADLTAQANHLGATIEADIVKQKLPTHNGGFKALPDFGKTDERVYSQLSSDHPIDLTRYQVLNGYAGRVGLINSGGASGEDDFQDAIRTAIINKRAGGMGLICGRKAFQRSLPDGVELLHTVQDVYLEPQISIA